MTQPLRINIDPIVKESLDELKTDEKWTYSLVVDSLIDEHYHHADILAEKEKKIQDIYIEGDRYSELANKYTNDLEKIKELEGKIGELNNKNKEFVVEIKKQQDEYIKIQNVLTVKEDEINITNRENNELKEEMDKLKAKHDVDISGMKKEYNSLDTRYDKYIEYVNQKYIMVNTIKTLYNIAWFLHRHKRLFFTVDQLYDKIGYNTKDEISDALFLLGYKIFPIKKYVIKGVECFRFDRHYLK